MDLNDRVGDEQEGTEGEEQQDARCVRVAAEEGNQRQPHPGLKLVGRGQFRRRAELEQGERQRRERVAGEEDDEVVEAEAVVRRRRRVPEPRGLRKRQGSAERRLGRLHRRERDHLSTRHRMEMPEYA
jgi:hypothetical protein